MKQELVLKAGKSLSDKDFKHTMGTVRAAEKLAVRFGHDVNKAMTAALLHDIAKGIKGAKKTRMMKKYSLKSHILPVIDHNILGEAIAKKEFGIKDRAVLEAIRHHTAGREKMGVIAKIIYIADYIEDTRRFKSCRRAAKLVFRKARGVNEAVLIVINEKINYLISEKKQIHQGILKLWNDCASLYHAGKF